MIILRYMGRLMLRNFCLMALLLWLISFLEKMSLLAEIKTSTNGQPLSGGERTLMALATSSEASLDYAPVVFMVAAIYTLTALSRRAELHIIRGAGQSAMRILLNLATTTLVLGFLITFAIRPLFYEARNWAENKKDPLGYEFRIERATNQTAWFWAEDKYVQGRLENYDPITNQSSRIILHDSRADSLLNAYLVSEDIRLNGLDLRITTPEGRTVDLNLDSPPGTLPPTSPNTSLPLPHLLGWVQDDERLALPPRQRNYLIQQALAQPILSAVLVMLVGLMCVEVGTRQPLSRLVLSTLSFVVLIYSLYVIAHAFGLNGKSSPTIAAWGLPAALFFLSLALIALRDLSWHFPVTRLKHSQ